MPTSVTDEDISNLANDFFQLFARFEYSLKAAGYLSNRADNSLAEADWDGYALTEPIRSLFDNLESEQLNDAVNFILKNPPRKQIVLKEQLSWSTSMPPFKEKSKVTLIYLRRIRNNVFHGGKYKGGEWADRDRSAKLIKHSITILNHCLEASQEVYYAFSHP